MTISTDINGLGTTTEMIIVVTLGINQRFKYSMGITLLYRWDLKGQLFWKIAHIEIIKLYVLLFGECEVESSNNGKKEVGVNCSS